MSLKSAPYYWVVCDYPGCEANANECTEYSAWSDAGTAIGSAFDAEWLVTDDGEHFCTKHTIWDEETDELSALPTGYAGQLAAMTSRIDELAESLFRMAKYKLHQGSLQDRRILGTVRVK